MVDRDGAQRRGGEVDSSAATAAAAAGRTDQLNRYQIVEV